MKKLLLSTALLLIFFLPMAAQDSVTTTTPKITFSTVDFGIGYMRTDLGEINSFLSTYGYKPISENIATFSGSLSFSINRFVLRSEYTWQFPVSTAQAENIETSFEGYHLAASIGYLVLQRPTFRIYPYVGLNAFVSELNVHDKTPASSLDDLVNTPRQDFRLNFSNASLDFGIQFDKLFPLKSRRWDCPQSNTFMTVGLRAGYILGPGDVIGAFNNKKVEGAPSYSPNGPYVKLVIGLSTKMRDLTWKK